VENLIHRRLRLRICRHSFRLTAAGQIQFFEVRI
jgi:hypothetical protein